MRTPILAAAMVIALSLGFNGLAEATMPSCVSVMVDWDGLQKLVTDNFDSHGLTLFRKLSDNSTKKGYCLEKAPEPWRLFDPDHRFLQAMVGLVEHDLRQGRAGKVRSFFASLNQAKLIRGFERAYNQTGGRVGCTEVLVRLEINNDMYAVVFRHLHRPWSRCPVRFSSKVNGIAVLISTGIKAR